MRGAKRGGGRRDGPKKKKKIDAHDSWDTTALFFLGEGLDRAGELLDLVGEHLLFGRVVAGEGEGGLGLRFRFVADLVLLLMASSLAKSCFGFTAREGL